MISMAIELKQIVKTKSERPILRKMDLNVQQGEFLVLVGPSGCGKSTALRTIAGLERPDSGRIFLENQDVTQVEPQKRDVAMVFQNYALYPHLTVRENLSFALNMQKKPVSEIQQRIQVISEMLQIHEFLDRFPRQLSGGQRQRVALGRALSKGASHILFDEPLSNLDAHLREQMRLELRKLHQKLKNTVVYVTHDQIEAMTLGHRIAVMNEGQIEQIDSPEGLYRKPKNVFVAKFIGSPEMNFIQGHFSNQKFTSNSQTLQIPLSNITYQGEGTLGFRPEHIQLDPKGIPFQIYFIENHGAQQLIHLKAQDIELRWLQPTAVKFTENEIVSIGFSMTDLHFFDKQNTNLLAN